MKICGREFLQDELGHIRFQLKGNGYPIKLINNEIIKVREQLNDVRNNPTNADENPNRRKFIAVPYIAVTSERI